MSRQKQQAGTSQQHTASRALVQRYGATSKYLLLLLGALALALFLEATTEAQGIPGLGRVPVGAIVPFAGEVANIPAGWLLCDGDELTQAAYPQLYQAIAAGWGSKGAGKFNLPDLRGRFLRGVDHQAGRDEDSGKRTQSEAGGNAGNHVGSVQEDQLQSHKHLDAGHKHPHRTISTNHGRDRGTQGSEWFNRELHVNVEGKANLGDPVASSVAPIRHGKETRPDNAYVNWIIRAK